MKRMSLKLGTILVAASLAVGSLAGCGSSTKTNGAATAATATTAAATTQVANESGYPIKTDVTLSFWCQLNASVLKTTDNLGNTPLGKELEKKTGVKIKYIHPAQGTEKDQFNIMLASGDLPDMIEYGVSTVYPGGSTAAEKNGLIISLNDLLPKYAPNLMKKLKDYPELDKMIKTDEGKYYIFPHIRNDLGAVWAGPIVRMDWLKELNLPVPETIDEWYTVLKAFKEKKGATSPLAIYFDKNNGLEPLRNTFIGAYKTAFSNNAYIDDNGKAQIGYATPQYKEFLTTFRKWYSEGLIDKDFGMSDNKAVTTLIENSKTGAWIGGVGGSLRANLDKFKDKDPKFDLAGAKYPVLNKGEKSFSGQADFKYFNAYEGVITTACKNPEIAARWLDYAYGEEGNMIYNFGIEGESYTMADGKPQWTDVISKNPNGLTPAEIFPQYIKINGIFEDDIRYTELNMVYPQMKEAVKNWAQTDSLKHQLPPVSYTEEESKQLSKINADLVTYSNTMTLKFIMGVEPMENFDKYVDELKKVGLDKAIAIYQAANDRYNKR